MKTTYDDFYDHYWDKGNAYTAENNGPLPVVSGGHTHRLLK